MDGSRMMNFSGGAPAAPPTAYAGPERRQHVRLDRPFPARVQGVCADGSVFDLEVGIDNVSASGFRVTLPVRLERGARLSTTIRFSTVTTATARPKFLAVHGRVRRAEQGPDGTCRVGVEFEHHLFL